MASCSSCKKRTTSFCYNHKCATCDDCLGTINQSISQSAIQAINPAIKCQSNCVVGNYFDWLIDGEFEWPIKCTACNRIITADQSTNQSIRLVCKHVFHRDCLTEAFTKQLETKISSQTIDLSNNLTINQSLSKLNCLTCQAVVFDQSIQPKSKLRESVYQFLTDSLGDKQTVKQSDNQAIKSPEKISQSLNHTDTPSNDSLLLSPSATEEKKSSTVNQLVNQPLKRIIQPTNQSKPTITQSNKHSFDQSVSDSNIEDERAPLINSSIKQTNEDQSINQSRQRFAGATVIDIEDKQSASQSSSQSNKHSKKPKLSSHKKQSIKNGRLIVRLIVCLMILCFLSSIGLYVAFTMNWITFPKSKGS